jgi:lysyl-tRNA synthetase, class II
MRAILNSRLCWRGASRREARKLESRKAKTKPKFYLLAAQYFPCKPLRLNILPPFPQITPSQPRRNQKLAAGTKKKLSVSLVARFRPGRPGRAPVRSRRLFIISIPFTSQRLPLALDEHIYNLRRDKLKQIEALGQPAYRTKYEFTHTIPQIWAEFDQPAEALEANRVNVRVAGRIMAIRLMGKAGFAHLQQGGQKLQIYVKKDAVGEKGFELYKLLDLGDHIGVSGYLFRTRTGELSVHVEEITFLSKDLLPLPEKWHGLTDVELRYRQRYVDLVMNPEVREVFMKRTKLLQSMRRTFDSHGFVEVETPMMQPIAGGAVARPFVTHHNTLDMDLFLRIAPELYLKRLVVGGLDRVYEINRNFRNEGLGWRWNPEFTMLEAYQAYTDYQGIMNLTQESITEAAKAVTGGTVTDWTVEVGGEKKVEQLDWANWQRMTMREAIIRFWPEAAGPKPEISDFADSTRFVRRLESAREAAANSREQVRIGEDDPRAESRVLKHVFGAILSELNKDASLGKGIAHLFEGLAEDHLTQPTVIYEFPTAVSPLSKQKPDEPDWTERFEIYAGQMEIANGFSELNDPEDQRRRFEAQLKERERGDDEAHQMDEDYIRALSYGMPPTGGVGIGIDRLVMLLTDSHTIRDVILFPVLRPERTSPDEKDEKGDASDSKQTA